MLGKSANIFSVTQLFNLDLSEVGLKRYSKILRERVNGELMSNPDKKFRVEASFKVVNDLVVTQFDHVAIGVEVIATLVNDNDDEEAKEAAPKTLFGGFFVCTGLTRAVEGAAQLPLLVIYKSQKSLQASVNYALEVDIELSTPKFVEIILCVDFSRCSIASSDQCNSSVMT